MGCDIHEYVEVRKNGKWTSVDVWEVNEENELEAKRWININRNYDLFAILADVRNGRGFAGIVTGEGFNPISKPKGLPADCDARIYQASEWWGEDGHSHSWVSVAEILAFDWTQKTKQFGVVSAAQYEDWIRWRRGRGLGPEAYCGGISGCGILHITNKAMDELLAEGRANSNHYTKVEWFETYYQAAPQIFGEFIPRALRLGDPSEVRLVFWFDN
jgi:hypothetical protein